MKPRVTLRDIARVSGVHFTTAGRALKRDPRISPETQARVCKVAKEMNYSPDPMMSALCRYRQSTTPSSYHGTIAWLTNFPTRNGWRCHHSYEMFFSGAARQAAVAGYHLEEVWLKEPHMKARRIESVLLSRGIRGILIPPQPRNWSHLSLRFDSFSAVALGYSMARPNTHRISTAHARSIELLMRKLRRLGHRRIGWASASGLDERMKRIWSGSFWSELHSLPESKNIPILAPKEFNEKVFIKWFKKYRPEAIVTPDKLVLNWLRNNGYSIPEDVGVVFPNLQPGDDWGSGIVEQHELAGTVAIDWLIGMLQRGERGLPQSPMQILIDGAWSDGLSGLTILPQKAMGDNAPEASF